MNTEDELLVLAHAIDLYDRVVRSMTELADLGAPVPHIIIGRSRQQLTTLAQLWWADVHGDPVWHDSNLSVVTTEAHAWATTRQERLLELKEGKRYE